MNQHKIYEQLFAELDALSPEEAQEQGRRLLVMAGEVDLDSLARALLAWGKLDISRVTGASGGDLLDIFFCKEVDQMLRDAGMKPKTRLDSWREWEQENDEHWPEHRWGETAPPAGRELEPGIHEVEGRPGEYVVNPHELFKPGRQPITPLYREVLRKLLPCLADSKTGKDGVWASCWVDHAPGQTYGEVAVEYMVFDHEYGDPLDQLDVYLECGADINGVYHHQASLLMFAVELNDQFDIALWLLEHGVCNEASPTWEDRRQGFLHSVVEQIVSMDPHSERYQAGLRLVEKWLERPGAYVDVRTEYGDTPLHSACQENNEALVSLLLAHGADVHARTLTGRTPLHCATAEPMGVQQLLLEAGADPWAVDADGLSPITEELMYSCHDGLGSPEAVRRMLAYAGPMPPSQRLPLLALLPSLGEEGRAIVNQLLA